MVSSHSNGGLSARHRSQEPRVLVVDLELSQTQPKQVGHTVGSNSLNFCGPGMFWPSMQKEKQGKVEKQSWVYAVVYIDPEKILKTRVCRLDALKESWKERFVFGLWDDFYNEEYLCLTLEVYSVQPHGRGDTTVGSARYMVRNVLKRVGVAEAEAEVEQVVEDHDIGEIVECGPDVEWEGSTAGKEMGRVEVRLWLQVWKEDFPRARQSGGANWAMKYNELMCAKESEEEVSCIV